MLLNKFLTRLILICILPLALLTVWMAVDDVLALHEHSQLDAANLAGNFATSIDQLLSTRVNALNVMAQSPLADQASSQESLYREAQGFQQSFGSHVILADLNMRMLFNTRAPYGSVLPRLPTPQGNAAGPLAMKTGKPAIGDLVPGPVAGKPLIAIAVPVLRNGKVTALLLATYEQSMLQTRLDKVLLPSGWSLALLDSRGKTIARSPAAATDSLSGNDSGETFVVKSSVSPWSVVVTTPPDVLHAPLREVAIKLAVAVLLAIVAGIAGGTLAGRRLSREVASLVETPGAGSAAPKITEIASVRQLLDESGRRRMAAETARDQTEEKFAFLLRDAPGIAVQGYDRDGIVRHWNRASERLYGYTAREVIGRPLLELIVPPEMRAEAGQAMCQVAGTGVPPPAAELSQMRKDGTRVAVLSSQAVVQVPGREPELFRIDIDLTQQRMTEHVLKQSESRYSSLFEHMLNGFAYCRMEYDEQDRPIDFVYIDVNCAFDRLTGLHDVEGKRATDVIPGIRELSPEIFGIYGRVARGGKPETFEFHFKQNSRWLRVTAYCPETGYFVAIFEDFTERRKAEQALLDSEKKYHDIYDNLQDVYIETTLEGIILQVSPRVEALFRSQYRVEDLIGKVSGTFYADLARRDLLLQTLRRDGRIIDFEVDLKLPDGGTVPTSISAKFSHNADGKPSTIVSTMRDVSARRRVQRELAEANVKFQAMVEQSIAGILIIQDGRFAYVNPRFCEILGYPSQDELIGMDALSTVDEADRGGVMNTMRGLMEGTLNRVSHTFAALRKDGTTIDLGVSSSRATYMGQPAIISMMQDISEKKRDEEAIQRYIAQLKTAFMSTVEVAMTIAEMRDPYTSGHERRVAQLAVAIGAEMGFDDKRLEGLKVAAFLHDIGKIIVPAEILAKPGKLNKIERQLIQGHPQASFDILKSVAFPWPLAEVVLQHHERLDGSGYPQGLHGDAIHLEARILAVADTVEAMSSHRPYRAGLGMEAALEEIRRHRSTLYDPAVVDATLSLFLEKGFNLANDGAGNVKAAA